MGNFYDQDNRLCCDFCGVSGGVRRYKCPFGYCKSIAACPSCRKKHKEVFSKGYHREQGCEKSQMEFDEREAKKEGLLNDGKAIRCSALGVEDGKVHVLFRKKDGSMEGYCMSKELYNMFQLLEVVTPDDFKQHGELKEASNSFYN